MNTISITNLAKAFGIGSAPWVIRAYLTLLIACAVMMVFAMLWAGGNSTANDAAHQVLTLSIDSFKIILGAVMGALSMAAHQWWGGENSGDQATK